MRGKRLSERTMGHAKLNMLIDYYLGDMQRRGCTEDSVSTNRRALGRFARAIDLNAHQVTLQEVTEEVVERYVTNMQRRNVRFVAHPVRKQEAGGESPDWQRRNLSGNVIHFGMYTSLARPTGHWSDEWRRKAFEDYSQNLEEEWKALDQELRETGFWPRPASPEMVCRWDIQVAPPDILVTNYSMLEYMLIRPIESGIFPKHERMARKRSRSEAHACA